MESPEKTQINNLDETEKLDQIVPEEKSGIYVQGFVRISDPDTGEILLETRA